jgi:hypothetical protein
MRPETTIKISGRRWLPSLLSVLAIWLVAASAPPVTAQSPGSEAAAKAPSTEDANNPLAKFQAFNMHDYYVPSLTEAPDQKSNTYWFRYAQPFGKWLFRASLPVSTVPTGTSTSTSGLGDLNAFAAYLFDTGNPKVSVGLGPQVTAPTASEDATGTGRWLGGLALVYFNAESKAFQWGGLVTWQKDFAGDADRPAQNIVAVQPFYFVQMGNGLYFRGAPVWAFNLENNSYAVPMGLGIGKVVPTPSTVFNIFIEPQYTILSRGAMQPQLQIFVGFNMQFVKK